MNSASAIYGYDPRGVVVAEARKLSSRLADLHGLRLGVLDNAKMKAGKLLAYTTEILNAEFAFSAVNSSSSPITSGPRNSFKSPASAKSTWAVKKVADLTLAASPMAAR